MHISKLSKYSYKAIIQFAYNKMKQQGFEQSKTGSTCKYLGPNNLRCGASWFLTEEEADWGDRQGDQSISNIARILGYEPTKGKIALLESIQSAHDNCYTGFYVKRRHVLAGKPTMKSRFLKLAEVYGVELKE